MNTIELAKKYAALLDEAYMESSKTAVLESDSTLAREGANANEICVPMIDMDGLADYSRNSGYVKGDNSLTWQTVQFNYERGRMFSVDRMDNEETQNLAFGRLAGEFLRTKAIPELDAFRFSKICEKGAIKKLETLNTGDNIISAIRAAATAMDNDQVPLEDRYLFVTSEIKGMIDDMDNNKSRAVMAGFAGITVVPQTRFYTRIALLDGVSEGEKAGGYTRAPERYVLTAAQPADWATNYTSYFTKSGEQYTAVSAGSGAPSWSSGTYYAKEAAGGFINFMVIHKPAVIQFTKHAIPKIITPEMNQDADAWKYGYRNYGLTEVYANKTSGVYTSYHN